MKRNDPVRLVAIKKTNGSSNKKYDGTYFYGDLYSKTMVIFQGFYLKPLIILEVFSFGKMMWKKS